MRSHEQLTLDLTGRVPKANSINSRRTWAVRLEEGEE